MRKAKMNDFETQLIISRSGTKTKDNNNERNLSDEWKQKEKETINVIQIPKT